MLFHIDESGNTGLNLFDENQRRLSYGLLSSKLNVDALGVQAHRKMTNRLGVRALHANEMGARGLVEIADLLHSMQRRFRFGFDYYYIDKPTHALAVLFDAVFDAGINDAVKWDLYWTHLRFPALINLASILDEQLLKEAWFLCTAKDASTQSGRIVDFLTGLKARTSQSPLDARSKELFNDAFEFGIRHPMKLDFGASDANLVSPNAVGFQFVVRAIARRSRSGRSRHSSIKVDRQQQFNAAQMATHDLLTAIADGMTKRNDDDRAAYLLHPLHQDIEERDLLLQGMPMKAPSVSASTDSIGLQIVDLYLWITNRVLRGDQLPSEVRQIAAMFLKGAVVDSISLEGWSERWRRFEQGLPKLEGLSDDQLAAAQANLDQHRAKVASLWADQ